MDTPTLELDGRKFFGVTDSLASNQDFYIQGHLRQAGAVAIMVDKKRTDEERSAELLTALMLKGKMHYIFAGCLTEVGKVWSLDEANRNAECFALIKDPAEKTLMVDLLTSLVAAFFSSGEPLSATSRKSSSRSAKVPPTKNAAPSTMETSPL